MVVTSFAFIAVDFKLAVDHPVEAGIMIGIAAILYRYMRKRDARELSQRLFARLQITD